MLFIIKHKPDALFTDIEIRGGIVITQVLQKLKLNGYEIPWLVFLTGHPGYGSNIINEFSHRAVKYIDKPFIHHWEVKFREALDEIHKRRYAIQDKEAIQAKNHFFIKQKDQLIRLEYDRILWITAAGNGKSFSSHRTRRYLWTIVSIVFWIYWTRTDSSASHERQ